MKKHKNACSKGQTEKSEKSAVAERQRELLLKEALHIQIAAKGSHFNRDGGIELHECWAATI